MSGFVTRLTSRGTAVLGACAVASMLTVSVPTKANADYAIAAALGVTLGLIVLGGGTKKKPTYTVIARYCEDPKTGLYHQC